MAEQALRQSGMPTGNGGVLDVDYYVPDFRIEVEGKELAPATHGDVLEFKVTLETDQIGSFDITFNNWDDEHLTFKYSDSADLMVGNMVRVSLGYVKRMRDVIHGPITGITPRFTESGALTVGISGKDSLEFLKSRKPKANERQKFVNMKDTDIAREIAVRNKLDFVGDDSTSIQHDVVYQKNMDDAQLLIERARRIDYDCYIRIDGSSSRGTLYFIRPRDGRDAEPIRVYVFEWGKNLISFTPQLSTNRQVSTVTVRGWDPRTKKAMVGVANPEDLPPAPQANSTSGTKVARDKFADRQNLIVDRPVASEREARELALSILREQAMRFNTGRAHVIGIPDLRPGDNVELKGLGKRFSGQYKVRKVEHTLGSSGFTTSFEVASEYCGE
jgi:phage protein D